MDNYDYIEGRLIPRKEATIDSSLILFALGVGVVFGASLMSIIFLVFG